MSPQTQLQIKTRVSVFIINLETDSELITVEITPTAGDMSLLGRRVFAWLLQNFMLKIRIVITPLWIWRRLGRIGSGWLRYRKALTLLK